MNEYPMILLSVASCYKDVLQHADFPSPQLNNY